MDRLRLLWLRGSARLLFGSLAALVLSAWVAAASAAAFAPVISEFAAPANPYQPNPWSIAAAGGKLWFSDQSNNVVDGFDPSTHAFGPTLIPWFEPDDMSIGSDGNAWFTDEGHPSSAVGVVDATNSTVHEYSSGLNPGSYLSGISAGSDGNVWFTDFGTTSAIGVINPDTHAIHEYSAGLNGGSHPLRITAAPDGNLWFTDQSSTTPAIGQINPITHAVHEYWAGLEPGSAPRGIAVGADGNVWFTDSGSTPAIGEINPTTHTITEYTAGLTGSRLNGIAAGPDGNLWFADERGALGEINPTTHDITEYTTGLNSGSDPIWFTSGPDASMWFTDGAGYIGQVTTGATSTTRSLTVSVNGSGHVTSSSTGISCPGSCTHSFAFGVPVALTAEAPSGYTFAGWSGPCSGAGKCTAMMFGPSDVSAKFTLLKPHGTKITKATVKKRAHRATFKFRAGGVVTGFQCALVKKHHKPSFKSCRSAKTYKHLKSGHYTFEVRAVNSSGADPRLATKKFTI